MGYATTTSGYKPDVQRSSNTRTIRKWNLNGWEAVINQKEIVTEHVYVGLTKEDALTLCTSYDQSTLDGVNRTYLGSCTVTKGLASIIATGCWGVRLSAQMSKMGDTNMY